MALQQVDLITNTKPLQVSDYLIYPWLVPGRLTLLVGATNIGKSTLTLELIAATLKGGHLWDRYPCKKITKVLYLHAEHTLETIQEAATARGDIDPGSVTVIHEFGDAGASLLVGGRPNVPLIKDLYQAIMDIKPQLIIAEPITAFIGTSENDNREVRATISILNSLSAKVGAAVLTHHHVGKVHFNPEYAKPISGVATGEARGAMAFEDAAEKVIYLRRINEKKADSHIKLETPKAKGYSIAPAALSFDEDTLKYSYVSQPFAERDIIAIYARRRAKPEEKITDLIDFFKLTWKCSTATMKLYIRRAAKVGLLDHAFSAEVQKVNDSD